MSKIRTILSIIFIFTIWGCVSSACPILLWWSRECVLYLIIIIKPEVWIINHCLGLGHETMVCAVCLTMFLHVYAWHDTLYKMVFAKCLITNWARLVYKKYFEQLCCRGMWKFSGCHGSYYPRLNMHTQTLKHMQTNISHLLCLIPPFLLKQQRYQRYKHLPTRNSQIGTSFRGLTNFLRRVNFMTRQITFLSAIVYSD